MTAKDRSAGAATHAEAAGRLDLVGRIRCPHCWHRFRTEDILWIAKHEDMRGDPVLGENEPLRFLPSRFNVDGEALDGRGMACQQLACPSCHLLIPRVFLEAAPLIFSLIGVPASGKSYFLAAMTWGLSQLLPRKFLLAFNDVDPQGNQTLTDYVSTLFLQPDENQLVGIEKTEMASDVTYAQVQISGQAIRLPRPFLFALRPADGHPAAKKRGQASRILCLYDNAGEHFLPGMDRTLAPGTQHVARSRVLMFLYDPTQDARFRHRCQQTSNDPQLQDAIRTPLQSGILTEAALRVQQYAGLSPSAKLDKPLLVLVSKSDIWKGLIDDDIVGEPYIDPSAPGEDAARVDLGRIERTSGKLRELMLELAPEFVAAAEVFFRHVVYIPVSALGRSPQRQETTEMLLVRPKDIAPAWATVPIMYSFSKWSAGLVFAGSPA